MFSLIENPDGCLLIDLDPYCMFMRQADVKPTVYILVSKTNKQNYYGYYTCADLASKIEIEMNRAEKVTEVYLLEEEL